MFFKITTYLQNVYIEALDCCIIIEFLGMTDDYEYVMDLVGKIAKYARHDVFINRDLLLIAGTVDYMPSSDYIKGCIYDYGCGICYFRITSYCDGRGDQDPCDA